MRRDKSIDEHRDTCAVCKWYGHQTCMDNAFQTAGSTGARIVVSCWDNSLFEPASLPTIVARAAALGIEADPKYVASQRILQDLKREAVGFLSEDEQKLLDQFIIEGNLNE